ncbi:MAG: hypothetical protein ACRC6M_15020 [Microcystaceae cyanobacterium]
MNTTANTSTLTSLRLLFSTGDAQTLMDAIDVIYAREIEQAKGRTEAAAKLLIKSQLETLPIQTFGINLDDVDLESLATGFMPLGTTFN